MNKNRRLPQIILASLLLGMILCFSVGLSIWLITDRIEIKPELGAKEIIKKYMDNDNASYDGNILLPSSTELGLDMNSEDLTYYYKEADSQGDYIPVDVDNESGPIGPINAGEYLIKVEYVVSEDTNPDDDINDSVIATIEDLKFTINKRQIDVTNLSFTGKTVDYNRQVHNIKVTGERPSTITDIIYTCDSAEFAGATDADTYNVKATFVYDTVNYEIVKLVNEQYVITNDYLEATLQINKKSIALATLSFIDNADGVFYHTGSLITEIESTFVVTDDDGTELEKDKDYTVEFSDRVNLGLSHTVTVKGINNYDETTYGSYKIQAKLTNLVITANNSPQILIYNGEIQRPSVTVTDGNGVTVTGATLSYDIDTKDQGLYNVNVTASKDGYISATKEVTILIKPATVTLSWTWSTIEYDGQPHNPTVNASGIFNDGYNVGVELTDAQTNAGIHTATAKFVNDDSKNYKFANGYEQEGEWYEDYSFAIAKKNITLSTDSYDLSYQSTVRVWDSTNTAISTIKNAIVNLVKFNGVIEGDTVKAIPDGMHNNIYAYGNVKVDNLDTSMSNVVGSTYQVSTEIDNSNYNLTTKTFILKYKTVLIDGNTSTFYTIEDAFEEATSLITFIGDSSSTSTYVATSFTGLSLDMYNKKTTYTLSGVKLVVPYNNDASTTLTDNYDGSGKKITVIGNVYSALVIPKQIRISIENSGGIAIAAAIDYDMNTYTSASTTRGVLVNNGTIHVQSGEMYAFGYIKGVGEIILEQNTTMLEMMTIYDWHGGNATSKMYKDVFPVNAWSMRNNICKTTIKAGANYKGRVYVIASLYSLSVGDFIDCDIIGSYSSTNSMFKPTSASEIGEIIKSTEADSDLIDSLNQITTYNQTRNKDIKECINIAKGNYMDAKLNISKTIILKVELSTDDTKPLPISFMDILISNGASLRLENSDYLFFPGTQAKVEEGGVVTIGSGIDVTFASCNNIFDNDSYKDYSTWFNNVDACLLNNGSIIVEGSIGGKILSETKGANIDFKNGSTSSTYKSVNKTTSPYYYTSGAINSVGCINGKENELFYTKNNYIYNGSFWFKENAIISFVSNGSIEPCPSISITINSDGYVLDSLPNVTKTGYEFRGWYFDEEFTDPAKNVTIYESVTLYALWEIQSYSIIFDTDGGNVIDTITDVYNSVVFAPNDPVKDGYIFNGWFDANGVKVSFPISMPVGGMTLTAHWVSETVTLHTVTFNCAGGTPIDSVTVESGTLINANSYITTKNGYNFVEWQFEGEAFDFNETITSDMELTAVWSLVEYTIDYVVNGGTLSDTPVNTYTIESETFNLPDPTKTGYTFEGWYYLSDYSGNVVTQIEHGKFGDVILYAKYKIDEYTIKYLEIEAKDEYLNKQTYTIEDVPITLKAPTKEGYTFDGWLLNGDLVNEIPEGTTGNITLTAQWTKNSSGGGCVAAGTLITLANGTMKPVEELTINDLLLVLNHETGKYEAANIIFIDDDGWNYYNVLNLSFSMNYNIKVIYEHGFFDLDLGKYVYITLDNYHEFIGHRFAVTDIVDGECVEKVVTLENAYIQEEYTGCYSPVTVYHLNYFTNGLLSMPGGVTGLFNMFEFNEDMVIDKELMEQDIEKYGLYTYEDFEEYIPYEIYTLFPAPYLKVSVGKGIVTFEEIIGYIDRYLQKMLDSQK